MKIYDILETGEERPVGALLYFEKEKSWVVELRDDLDEWSAPLLFSGFVKEGIYTMPRDVSRLWVRERVVPHDRQNIGSILSRHHLKEYDEMKLLELSDGKCSQDNLFIRKTGALPDFAEERINKNLSDCAACSEDAILCLFRDGVIRKVAFRQLADSSTERDAESIRKLLRNRKLFASAQITAGGYAVTFDDQIDIPANLLHESGVSIPLQQEDLICFMQNNLLDTVQACQLLDCSRQNLSYLIRKNRIRPIMGNVKGKLFLKGEVLRNME